MSKKAWNFNPTADQRFFFVVVGDSDNSVAGERLTPRSRLRSSLCPTSLLVVVVLTVVLTKIDEIFRIPFSSAETELAIFD